MSEPTTIHRPTVPALEAIQVLDHGLVRLIDSMGNDQSIVRAARVSYDAAWRAGEDEGSDHRLIRYLWKHGHTSPFESVTLTFEVKAPIFVLRQWMRHRTWSFNEVSGRYRELTEEYYLPAPDKVGTQSKSSKQARDISDDANDAMRSRREDELNAVDEHCADAFVLYRDLLASGWPRELARTVLPLSTYSHCFATVNLLNLFRFLTLRSDPHAQYEIRQYANAMLQAVERIAPVAIRAWKEARSVVA